VLRIKESHEEVQNHVNAEQDVDHQVRVDEEVGVLVVESYLIGSQNADGNDEAKSEKGTYKAMSMSQFCLKLSSGRMMK